MNEEEKEYKDGKIEERGFMSQESNQDDQLFARYISKFGFLYFLSLGSSIWFMS